MSVAELKMATREAVGSLEHRFGRKRVYVVGTIIVVLLALLVLRAFLARSKPTPPPPVRPVLVAKVISKDVPLYLDEIGTCAAYETVQVQAQVSGQIIDARFPGRCRREERRSAFHDRSAPISSGCRSGESASRIGPGNTEATGGSAVERC